MRYIDISARPSRMVTKPRAGADEVAGRSEQRSERQRACTLRGGFQKPQTILVGLADRCKLYAVRTRVNFVSAAIASSQYRSPRSKRCLAIEAYEFRTSSASFEGGT